MPKDQDHHPDCAKSCIKSGLPVGIKSESDGKLYLIVGDHNPPNDSLSEKAGKVSTSDGMNLPENASIVE